MGLLARHPAPVAVAAAALAATAVVFAFFRPTYHPKGEDSLVKVDWSLYPPASTGWTWANGQPGFRFAEQADEWPSTSVTAAELAPALAAARRWGVAPASVRLLAAIRIGVQDLIMLVAGTDAADHTCIGFVTPSEPVEYVCPNRLGPQSAFVLVAHGATGAWVMGISRGDVTRIVVDQPPDWNEQTLFSREQGSFWGTWSVSLGDSDAIVTAYLRDGSVRRVAVDPSRPTDRVIAIPG